MLLTSAIPAAVASLQCGTVGHFMYVNLAALLLTAKDGWGFLFLPILL